MTHAEIATMLSGTQLPYAYYQFPEGSGQRPPFLCFYYSGRNDVIADNSQYAHVEQLVVELYTDNKDFTAEETVETALTGSGLIFGKAESYIPTEMMHMVTYTSEFVLTQEETNNV